MSDFIFWAITIFAGILVITAIVIMVVVSYRTNKEIKRIQKETEEHIRAAKIKEEHIRLARQRRIARESGEKVEHVKNRFTFDEDDLDTRISHTSNSHDDDSYTRTAHKRAEERASRNSQDAAAINAATSVIFFN